VENWLVKRLWACRKIENRMSEIEWGITSTVENWLVKRLWACRKIENRMSEINITMFWDMTPCSLVNMNTDISAKPAD